MSDQMLDRGDSESPPCDEAAQWDTCDECGQRAQGCVTIETCGGEGKIWGDPETLCPACAANCVLGDDQLYHPVGDAVSKLRKALDVALAGRDFALKALAILRESASTQGDRDAAELAEREARRLAGMEDTNGR